MVIQTLLILLAMSGAAPAAAELSAIGAAAAVSGLVKAEAPGAVGRVVQSGKPLYLNDHVTTDAKGRLQVLLLDETVFTLGPNSDMVLDEFVYDAASGAGKVSANVTKGVFRFVTGKVARKDPAAMKVKLAVGTIGIRGTMVAGSTGPEGSTVILLGPGALNNANENPGQISITNAGGPPVVINSPGFGLVMLPNQLPPPPMPMPVVAARLMQQLTPLMPPPPPPAPGAPAPPPALPGSAGQMAGQNTANLNNSALNSQQFAAFTEFTGGEAGQATQQIYNSQQTYQADPTSGVASWDNVRSLQVPQMFYSAGGNYSCVGPGCLGYPSGLINFDMVVDLGARTYEGNLNFDWLGQTANIVPTDINALSGPAVIPLTLANTGTMVFNGSVIYLNNSPAGLATEVVVVAQYNDGAGTMAGGLATGTGGPLGGQ